MMTILTLYSDRTRKCFYFVVYKTDKENSEITKKNCARLIFV